MFFRVRGWVRLLFHNCLAGRHFVAPVLVRVPLLESEVMRHSKDPPAEISPRTSHLQMPEQRQENFLGYLFGVVQ
jgi:hypothetical protein